MTKKYILQLGLAFVLLYAGISAWVQPQDWIGFVPTWVTDFGTSRLLALHLHSVAEIILGVWLLSNFQIRLAAWLTAADLAVIILVNGFDSAVFTTTFRDIGLLAAAVYLGLI